MSRDSIAEIRMIYRIVYRSGKNAAQSMEDLERIEFQSAEAKYLLKFLSSDSHRGILKRTADDETSGSDNV
ncbi:hypothetical protein EB093_04195 [bacterium]|nr:hypothetical protein [bacterium]